MVFAAAISYAATAAARLKKRTNIRTLFVMCEMRQQFQEDDETESYIPEIGQELEIESMCGKSQELVCVQTGRSDFERGRSKGLARYLRHMCSMIHNRDALHICLLSSYHIEAVRCLPLAT